MKRKKSSIGCLFWIALILLVLVVFLFNRDNINNALEITGFNKLPLFKDIFMKKEKIEENPIIIRKEKKDSEPIKNKPEDQISVVTSEQIQPQEELNKIKEEEKKPEDEQSSDEQNPSVNLKIRRSKLYYVVIDDNGKAQINELIRPISYSNAPLTETLKSLIEGLSPSELNKGYTSLIPSNTVIQSIWVKDKVAYINFNDKFRFNPVGSEGFYSQIKQIVYTATDFTTVDHVQILIDGKKQEYLAEGIYIGGPLNRNSF
jgi:spore germination protein GerM